MEKKNIVSSVVEPNKKDLWLKGDALYYYGNNGWENLDKEVDLSKYDNCFNNVSFAKSAKESHMLFSTVKGGNNLITFKAATNTWSGLMAAADKAKLDDYPTFQTFNTNIQKYVNTQISNIPVDDKINEDSSNAVKNKGIAKALKERAYGAIFTITGDISTLTTESTDEEIRNALAIQDNIWLDAYKELYPDKSTDSTDSFYIRHMFSIIRVYQDAHMNLNDIPYWIPVYLKDFSEVSSGTYITLSYIGRNIKGKLCIYIIYLKEKDLVWSVPQNPTILDLENVSTIVERETPKTFASWDDYNNYVSDISFILDTANICRKLVYYNTENNNYSSVNFSQTLNSKYCKQIALIGVESHERLITFTDSTRGTIESIGNWT